MADFTQNRSNYIRIFFVAIPFILIVRLLFLQVFGSGGYKDAAIGQAVYIKKIYPPRGIIFDRNNKVLMNNSVVYDLVIEPSKVKADFDTAFLCKMINVSVQDFDKQIKKQILKYGAWQKVFTIYRNLSPTTVARLQENLYDFTGVDLMEHSERNFTEHCGGNFVGYINEISKEQLELEKFAGYQKGDYIGITGIESMYEDVLRGQPGVQYLLRDVKQKIQGPYKNGTKDSSAIPGKSLQLYIDARLQKIAEEMMANKLGSAVAIDPNTGGILAFASGPSFNPDLLTGADKSKNLGNMLVDATKPLFNRAIKANYPPGSTFKPITALVALDEGVITPSFGYPCGGGYYACGRRIGCTHSGGGHAANLSLAIANSCNAYFCHVFRLAIDAPKHGSTHVGLERWHHYMNEFGLGHPIGIDIPSENGGNIPDSNYFDRVYNKNWNSCNMSIIGMGQGEILMTPLQMANAMCIIANKGYYYIPHFVKSIDGDSTHAKLGKYLQKHVVANIADSAYNAVGYGMMAVVDQGTGKIARIPGIEVCAKTGTAQNERMISGKRVKLQNHSMFVAYAPRVNPKIAVAVCIENAGYGATWAGPIASLMIEQYLTDTIAKSRLPLKKKMDEAKIIPNYTFIIDSLEKQAARDKEMMKRLSKDSLKILNTINEKIQRRNDTIMAEYFFRSYFLNNAKS
ncbi:MAG: penicillin-binding protein 2 [Bacteroidetes bacterium]|mgnify:FL=1|jgi:penicillin-binding protein 2|nr:penicillin-binding protein 2 [Bacteroidota bacterium]MBK7040289.1 penicillin-binding protein 2 [Bacteroidota bacterium]MBK7586856.1 penicillin-binding protein 2 [Bacteroidota bacterium]MBK9481820.1 penicillin-binding protein 2 [Bacteroidota bacterium]